ncbi:hypothetical protein PR048_024411 [Dryococelus australis]|uniref:Uncharacterized protein n=1 Tax=Dryococelus australis TaxID=614101 RepID=A0ABQ9GNK4_9NEOP|nr:hypothetical protein PR048_024411 [Dryococelus australis]
MKKFREYEIQRQSDRKIAGERDTRRQTVNLTPLDPADRPLTRPSTSEPPPSPPSPPCVAHTVTLKTTTTQHSSHSALRNSAAVGNSQHTHASRSTGRASCQVEGCWTKEAVLTPLLPPLLLPSSPVSNWTARLSLLTSCSISFLSWRSLVESPRSFTSTRTADSRISSSSFCSMRTASATSPAFAASSMSASSFCNHHRHCSATDIIHRDLTVPGIHISLVHTTHSFCELTYHGKHISHIVALGDQTRLVNYSPECGWRMNTTWLSGPLSSKVEDPRQAFSFNSIRLKPESRSPDKPSTTRPKPQTTTIFNVTARQFTDANSRITSDVALDTRVSVALIAPKAPRSLNAATGSQCRNLRCEITMFCLQNSVTIVYFKFPVCPTAFETSVVDQRLVNGSEKFYTSCHSCWQHFPLAIGRKCHRHTRSSQALVVARRALARLFVSHLGELGSFPGGVAPGFSDVGIVPDDAAGQGVSSGVSSSPRPCFPVLPHT